MSEILLAVNLSDCHFNFNINATVFLSCSIHYLLLDKYKKGVPFILLLFLCKI